MAPKRAQYLTYGNDGFCMETRKFIEDAGVLLNVRDISKEPLSEEELSKLVSNLEITHFLNTLSDSYTKFRLDKHLPDRKDILRLMAKDHTLLRRPIVTSARLLTIGCDKRKIASMLQINTDNRGPGNDIVNTNRRPRSNHHTRSAATSK